MTQRDLPLEVYKGAIFDRMWSMGLQNEIPTLNPQMVTEAAKVLRNEHLNEKLDWAVADALNYCWIQ